MRQIIEKAIKEKINPILMLHGGEVELVSIENRDVIIRFKGACANCPSASETLENIVTSILRDEIPSLNKISVNQGVSDDMINFARRLLKN